MQVNIKLCTNQLIHLEVKPGLGDPFLCSFVYAYLHKKEQIQLLSSLEHVALTVKGPWIAMGDFNCIANLNEKIGQVVRMIEILPLRNCMATCGLHDMKSNGRFYAWNNKQTGIRRVFSKVDRTLCNDLWEDQFPTAEVSFLSRSFPYAIAVLCLGKD